MTWVAKKRPKFFWPFLSKGLIKPLGKIFQTQKKMTNFSSSWSYISLCLYVYFSKAHPWDRRYSARIKTSNVYYIWAPVLVNPITQSAIVWSSNLCAAKFSHNNSDPVTAFHFAMSVGAKHQYLAEVSLHLTGFPETIQKMDCELRQVGSASYSDGPWVIVSGQGIRSSLKQLQ